MIGYKDRTWCLEDQCERFSQDRCYRAFIDEEKEKAEKWWGGKDFPVSAFATRPECYKEKG